MEFQTAPMVNV